MSTPDISRRRLLLMGVAATGACQLRDGRGVTVRISGPWASWLGSIGGPAIASAQADRIGTRE